MLSCVDVSRHLDVMVLLSGRMRLALALMWMPAHSYVVPGFFGDTMLRTTLTSRQGRPDCLARRYTSRTVEILISSMSATETSSSSKRSTRACPSAAADGVCTDRRAFLRRLAFSSAAVVATCSAVDAAGWTAGAAEGIIDMV